MKIVHSEYKPLYVDHYASQKALANVCDGQHKAYWLYQKEKFSDAVSSINGVQRLFKLLRWGLVLKAKALLKLQMKG